MQKEYAPIAVPFVAGQYAEWCVQDMTAGRFQAQIITEDKTWGGGVIKFYGSVSHYGPLFHEINSSITLTAAGLTNTIDVTGLRRVRAVIDTGSSTSGARVELTLSTMNPYR